MAEVVVAGHLCLDIIPELPHGATLAPGSLIEAGAANLSTGGAVSNVGLALRTLGIDAQLIGSVGDDLFGSAALGLLGPAGAHTRVCPDSSTSYTVVINLSDSDRIFLHNPGCNRTFQSAHVPSEALSEARILHFGYPPLLEAMFADDGEQLVELFSRAKSAGATTSLDLSLPDRESNAGKANWRQILRRVLPLTDLFCPSLDELEYMLGLKSAADLANDSLGLGAKIVAVKRGPQGLLLRSSEGFQDAGRAFDDASYLKAWHRIELEMPCFPVQVRGTTGSGDATIAGLLMGIIRRFGPEEAARAGCAVGAHCCEASDAVSGIRSWEQTHRRMLDEWT